MACKNVWKRFFEMIVQGVQRVCGDIVDGCRCVSSQTWRST